MDADNVGAAAPVPSADVSNGALRFASDVGVALFALLTGVLTARSLGPGRKGLLSTLGYLAVLLWPLAAVGTSDAGPALVGRSEVDFGRALRGSILLVSLGSLLGMPILFLATQIEAFGTSGEVAGRLAMVVALPATALSFVLPAFAEFQGRFRLTAAARLAAAIVTFVGTVVLVLGFRAGVGGAMVAVAVGPMVASAAIAVGLRRQGWSLVPAWDSAYVRRAVRLGLPAVLGYVVLIGVARLDLLVVAAFRSPGEVGRYSVALTVTQFVTLASSAISAVTFPRTAVLDAAAAADYTARALGAAVYALVASTVVLALVGPLAVPLVFGEGFRGATRPLYPLLVANLVAGLQWVAARQSAARGHTEALSWSYGASLVTMLGLDLVLVPRFGTVGAGFGAIGAAVVGLVIALVRLRRWGVDLRLVLSDPRPVLRGLARSLPRRVVDDPGIREPMS